VFFKSAKTYWRLSWEDRALLMEAVFFLIFSAIAIALLPFRKVGALAARPVHAPRPSQPTRALNIRRIRWAIAAAAARVPWRALCFQQGLAAHLMLRRRGVASVLYYGALQDSHKGLQAHVWVRDEDEDVVGCEIASHYAVLATFPAQDRPSEPGSGRRQAC
jgi:hypothetical protein